MRLETEAFSNSFTLAWRLKIQYNTFIVEKNKTYFQFLFDFRKYVRKMLIDLL